MCLVTRTINLKSGVVGEQRKEAYVAEWNLVFHETHVIGELLRTLTAPRISDSRDTCIHYELIGSSESKNFNDMMNRTLDVIRPKGNMFTLQSSTVFHKLLTQQNYPSEVSERIFNCIPDGVERYNEFKKEIFVEKSK